MSDESRSSNDEPVVQRAWAILRRRRLLASVVFMTLVASALGFAAYLPDLYQASALVLIERQVSEVVAKPQVNGELESRLQVIKQEILSRAHLSELIEKFNLYPALRKGPSMEDALDQTRRDIAIETAGPEQLTGRTKTVAFRVIYTGENRDSVADVTNALANFYVAQNDRMRSEEATRTVAILNQRLIDAKKQLDKVEEAMRSYTAQHTTDLPQQTGVTLASITRLNDQLRLNGEQQLNVMEQKQRLLEGVTMELQAQSIATPTPLNLSDPAELTKRILAKKDELQQLETRAKETHPDVIRLKQEIASLEREAAARDAEQKAAEASGKPPEPAKDLPPARKRALDALDRSLAQLKQVETDTRTAIAQYERRLEGVPAVQQEFQLLTRDQQSAKEQYDALTKQYNDAQFVASIETDRQGERFRILEAAIPPDGPKAPNRPRLLLMGLLLAIGAAVAAVLVAEQLDSSFHSLDDLRHFTRVPVLASIPAIDAAAGRRRAHVAVQIACAVAMIGLAGALSAHVAHGNQTLVRFLARAS